MSRIFGHPEGFTPNSPDLRREIYDEIAIYWSWRRVGCPIHSSPSPLMRDMIEACMSSDPVRLGALAGHGSKWVRLAVAGNNSTPLWAMWGDGIQSFGLASDAEPWVSAAVLLRCPRPPGEIVEAVKQAAALIELRRNRPAAGVRQRHRAATTPAGGITGLRPVPPARAARA